MHRVNTHHLPPSSQIFNEAGDKCTERSRVNPMDSVRMDTSVRRSVLSAVGPNCGAKVQFFPPQTLCGHSTKGARWQRGIYILNATTGEGTQAKWALGLTQDGISRPQGYSPPLGGGKSPKYRGMKQLHIMACR